MTEISDVIRNDLVITEENVSELMETAEMYSCFENVSRVLAEKCVNFYRDRKDNVDTEDSMDTDDIEDDEVKEDTMGKEDNMDGGDQEGFPSLALSVVSSAQSPVVENAVEQGDERDVSTQCEEVSQSERGDQEDSGPDDSICCSERDRLKMSLKNVCWVDFLKSETDLPADVTFKFYEKTKTTDGGLDGREVGRFVGDVKAHKFLLATCSQVFKERFFNSTNHQTNEIIIEDCSIRAFKTMVDFIYGRFPRLRAGSDICEIFEIENVAERFRIVGLKEEYKSSMMLYFRHRYKEHK